MKKEELRKQGIAALKAVSDSGSKEEKEAQLYQQLFADEKWQQAESIGVTMSMGFEIATAPIINRAWSEGKKVYVPKCLPQRKMAFYQIYPYSRFETSRFGVQEPVAEEAAKPEAIELLLVPGVVYSLTGYRIGFGGGYYDRFLEFYKGETLSLAFFEQIRDGWQPDDFDQKVEKVLVDKKQMEEER